MKKSKRIKEDWACSIIGQALAQIRTKDDIKRVMWEVSGTAIGPDVRPDLWKRFKELIKLKEKSFSQ